MNNHLLPTTHQASLPAKYEAAKIALAECGNVDECKDWADKSAALASYARQSQDDEMEKTAMRIRARAVRRCGELLKEIESNPGKRTDIEPRGSEAPRSKAANEAGLSKDQAKDAIRVANIPTESFEQQVESDEPPTITALAEQGKRPLPERPKEKLPEFKPCSGLMYADLAVDQLKKIHPSDKQRRDAFDYVMTFCKSNL